jgi:hypothetical protein
MLLDHDFKLNPLNDFGQAVFTVAFAPFLLG